MPAIRPDLISTLFPKAPGPAASGPAAQAARSSDFFSAALSGISPTPLLATPGKTLSVRPATPDAEPAKAPGRDMRPGSLLDIRV